MRLRKMIFTLFTAALGVSVLGACGVKPTRVDAPVGADPAQFPKPYPARTATPTQR